MGPGGKSIEVANWFGRELVVLDTANRERMAQITTGESPRIFDVFLAYGT